jgi:hypothetical protein
MDMRIVKILIAGASVAFVPAAWSDGIPVEPGLWETTTTINVPMMPQPQVQTTTQCMEKSEMNMDDVGTEGMDRACEFQMDQVDGNTMKWSVDCPVEGGTSHGEWVATSEGASVTGNGTLTIAFQGQSMEMTMSWLGKRIGDCN